MLNFYDFEVYSFNWMVVIINPVEKTEIVIVDDVNKLRDYYEKHKDEIWVGFNSRRYDTYILKGILLGFNPKEINDYIIVKRKNGWEYSSLFNKVQLYNYDIMTDRNRSLKQLEAFLGDDIKETSVPFNLDRPLTKYEINETIKYCKHDVKETMEVFINRIEEFEAHMGLIKNFKLPLKYISKTKAQLSAIILGASKRERDDEFEITIVDTIKINKYREILNWYKNPLNRDYKKSLEIEIAEVPHVFGWGGLHGARDKYFGEGIFINSDVGSFYPSLMIEYDFLSRNVRDKSKFKEIYDYRMKLKKEGKEKEQQPYKIVLNGTYGASKDKYNNLYDPLQANNVCINGQLMLLDLIEKVTEKLPSAKLIQLTQWLN